jgi:3-keto-5-aminohexanoate cleavage enzyme
MTWQQHVWDYRSPHEWMERVRHSTLPPLMVCCAVSGGVQGKEANPNLPESPEEIAQSTYEAYQAGASLVHVHARDPKKLHTSAGDAATYRLVNSMIRERCPDIIINNTTGGTWGMTLEERLSCLDGAPEMATLNMGPDMYKMRLKERPTPLPHPRPEVVAEGCMPVTYSEITTFAQAMRERGILPEMELYHPGQYWSVQDLIAQDLIQPPYCIQFVMGYQSSIYATPANVLGFVAELPANSVFFVAGIGPYQVPMTTLAILLGGHLRVGLEDNVYYRRGELMESNGQAVERAVRIARELNREIATPAQAREMLGLSQVPSRY